MYEDCLIIPNLGELGLPRQGDRTEADLITIWLTPYPVIGSYKRLAGLAGFPPFGGGSMQKQGKPQSGFVTSGYRDLILHGNKHSPHRYAIALDIIAGDVTQQIQMGRWALQSGFSRVGLYPDQGFIHVDVAPPNWVAHFRKARFWVTARGETRYYYNFEQAAGYAASL